MAVRAGFMKEKLISGRIKSPYFTYTFGSTDSPGLSS